MMLGLGKCCEYFCSRGNSGKWCSPAELTGKTSTANTRGVVEGHSAEVATCAVVEADWQDKWGVWKLCRGSMPEQTATVDRGRRRGKTAEASEQSGRDEPCLHLVRLCLEGKEVRGCFTSPNTAFDFHASQLKTYLGWPRQPLIAEPERSPTWDHSEELEKLKEYSFHEPFAMSGAIGSISRTSKRGHVDGQGIGGRALTKDQLQDFSDCGFVLGVPVLSELELTDVLREFEELLRSRIDNAPSDEARFRAAHTVPRPLHQKLVARLARHERVLAIVEDILGPRFVCWSAHLFCKLPGDPTEQPWHQDAGFWPISESRALTVWIAFDDVDSTNSGVTFVKGSHKLGRVAWQPTGSEHHLLTAEIPDVDLLGPQVVSQLRAGEASVHCDLTVHGSRGNCSTRRRAGLALRFVNTEAVCLGPMLNGYAMNKGCILPKGNASDPKGHWKSLRRRPGGERAPKCQEQ